MYTLIKDKFKKGECHMLKNLRKLFPSIQVQQTYMPTNGDYHWYVTKEGSFIRIAKDDMTEKDKILLDTFLQPIKSALPIQTEQEKIWHERIFEHSSSKDLNISFRFIYFKIQKQDIDPSTFKDAIQDIFSREMPIIWFTQNEGIIIEEKNNEFIDYSQIIDVLMSDLYVNIKFYVGGLQENLAYVKKYYDSILRNAKIGMKYVKKSVFSYIDIVPFLLIDHLDDDIKTELAETVLQDFVHDEEMLKMIETFISCNLNISLTAKRLYLHRNSLQYRIDRFIEQTNIDIREFHHALTVYFALLSLQKL